MQFCPSPQPRVEWDLSLFPQFLLQVKNSKMKTPVSIIFVLLLCGCNGNEERTQLQLLYSRYMSFYKTSLLFRNITAIVGGNSTLEQGGLKRGELISSRLLRVLPPFAVSGGNPECDKQTRTFLKRLDELDLWALKMYDSSGKLPSGLLNGNSNQFGDFDECLSVHEPELGIRGKYCLAYLQVRPVGTDFPDCVLRAFTLMQSHFMFKSKLTDPGHRVPRFSTMNWGLCVPSACTSGDVESQLKDIAERFAKDTGFEVEVKVESAMCQEKKPFRVSVSFFVVSCLFGLIVGLAIIATAKDVFATEDNPKSFHSILNCFSLKRNGKNLFSLSRAADDIESVHGIRMFNALMLLLCHKSMALFFMPYSNRTTMVEKLSQPWTTFVRTASLYTDSFIMISGLLTSYSLANKLKKSSTLDLKNEYISRLVRIVPSLAAIILLCTFILPELGSGPQWNLTVAHHADKCRKTWWKNFLFIHNYLGFENMCLTHTHHLGIDTQLFFISPLLVYLLYKWPMFGSTALVGLAAVSTWARFQVTAEKNLSFLIYPGISVGQMFDTANHSYIIPFHRLTAYVMGVLLGSALRYYKKDYRMKSHVVRIGWAFTFSFLSYILNKAGDMNHPGYVYNNREAAFYAALGPIAWCLFLSWLIFVSHIGYGGFLGKLLSSKYCLIWTRLSYAVYLTQFPIFFFNVGLQRHPQQYSFFLLVNILEYGCVILASIVLTLLFDMPFAHLKKLFMPK